MASPLLHKSHNSKPAVASGVRHYMKKIYSLEIEHEDDPKTVELTQKLTLDNNRPTMGLAGTYGLYGSSEWWENLYSGKLPKKVYEGIIENISFSGMDNESNSFILSLNNGGTYGYTCVANRKRNIKHYQVGRKVRVIEFVEKMKKGNDLEIIWSIEIENA